MWSFNKLFTAIIIMLFLASCGSNKKDPGKTYFKTPAEYNSYINRHFEEVNRLWNAALNKMDDSVLVYRQLDSLVKAADTSRQNMIKLADFKGDTLYKFAATQYFSYMLKMAQTDFMEAVEIMLMEDISDSLYFRFQAIGSQIGADKDTCINRLKAAQLHFVKDNEQ